MGGVRIGREVPKGGDRYISISGTGFLGGSDCKESACNAGDLGLIPGLGRSHWRREWLPILVFLPREFHRERRLASYSPWCPKQTDTTERLTHVAHSLCCTAENSTTL